MEFLDHLIKMADSHPFLAFCEIWLIGCLANVTYKLCNRILRTIKVAVAGWPKSPMDADGDIVYPTPPDKN